MKPCPWCGNTKDFEFCYTSDLQMGGTRTRVNCDHCDAYGPWAIGQKKQAIDAWDTRWEAIKPIEEQGE